MLNNNLLLFSFLSILFFSSCQQQPGTNSAIKLAPFFDIETYFKKEVATLKKVKRAQKTAAINGKKETKTLENLDFEKELAIFSKSNINKTSWLDKYEIDSVYNAAQQLTQLTYTAKEAKLRTRQVAISFENQQITKIELQNETQNIIAHSQQHLVYLPKKGYTIKSEQDMLFAEPREMMVEVVFF